MVRRTNEVKGFDREVGYYAYIRFFHALASDPVINVDIYVNKRLVVSNLSYEDFTNYLTAYPGSYQVEVYPTGTKSEPVLDARVLLKPNEIYTAAVVGTPTDVGIEVIDDVVRADNAKDAYMRFSNLSVDVGEVDVYVDDVLVVERLGYLELTEYLRLKAGKHTMKVFVADTGERIVSHPNLQLIGGNYYMTYVVGLLKGRPGVEVVIPLEGTSYLYPKTV